MPFLCLNPKKCSKCLVDKKKSGYFATKRVPRVLSVRCFDAVPYEKIEALCSFLQAENVGNFQSLQRMFGDGSCATKAISK